MAKILGMNDEEIRDFIVKHLPIRTDEKINLVKFLLQIF